MTTLDTWLDALVVCRGSDLHLVGGHAPLARVDRVLQSLEGPPVSGRDLGAAVDAVLDERERALLASRGRVELAVSRGPDQRFRAIVRRAGDGVEVTLRLLPAWIPSVTDLELPAAFVSLIDGGRGLVLVAAPAAGGATTTLAAAIDHVNSTRAARIVTVERVVEIPHRPKRGLVSHRQVGRDAADLVTALEGLAAADADVVLVGDVDDPVAATRGLSLAASGALVLVPIRARSAVGALERLLAALGGDRRVAADRLAGALAGVLAQQLLTASDGSGVVAAFELLVATDEVRQQLRTGDLSGLDGVIASRGAQGMQSMDADLRVLVERGAVAPLEALEAALDQDAMARVRPVANALAAD